jgi:hypothetical protein
MNRKYPETNFILLAKRTKINEMSSGEMGEEENVSKILFI